MNNTCLLQDAIFNNHITNFNNTSCKLTQQLAHGHFFNVWEQSYKYCLAKGIWEGTELTLD